VDVQSPSQLTSPKLTADGCGKAIQATHKHPNIQGMAAGHPRWTFHFTSTSASGLNLVKSYVTKP
jgi:hypothetical protein